MVSRGIDVSHYQGTVNWPALKRAHGLTWGACKASEGMTYTDASFTSNWSGMKAAGLVRVAYHFARPDLPTDTSAAAQADRFLAIVKPGVGDVLCLDLEKEAQGAHLSEAQMNAWARAFGLRLRDRAPGVATWLYCGGYAGNNSGANLAPYFDYWWYPHYATASPVTSWPSTFSPRPAGNTTGWPSPHIWQWAESLRTSEGLVDASVSPLSAAQLSTATTQEEDVPLTDAEKEAIAIEAANQVWNRFKVHGPSGDVSLADCLAQLLAKNSVVTKATGTATVNVNVDLTEA